MSSESHKRGPFKNSFPFAPATSRLFSIKSPSLRGRNKSFFSNALTCNRVWSATIHPSIDHLSRGYQDNTRTHIRPPQLPTRVSSKGTGMGKVRVTEPCTHLQGRDDVKLLHTRREREFPRKPTQKALLDLQSKISIAMAFQAEIRHPERQTP